MSHIDKNKFYLLLAYLSMSLLLVPLLLTLEAYWLRYLGLVIFIILLAGFHDALLRTIQQITGKSADNSELENFSAVLEMNKRMHDLLDPQKIIELAELTLQKQLGSQRVLSFVNKVLSCDKGEAGFEYAGKADAGEGSNIGLTAELHSYLLKQKRIVSHLDQEPLMQEVFSASDTDLGIPVIQNGMLLALILLKLPDGRKNCTDLELRMLDYLANQIGIILDRIRVYRQVMQQKELAYTEKMKIMESISSNIAHEMRTPLSGIRANISGLEIYLPHLLKAYDNCISQSLEGFSTIREDHLATLRNTPARITLMIDQANAVIDLLLMNLRNNSFEQKQLDLCSAAGCLEKAIDRYPFKSGERALVKMDLRHDFHFAGIESLFIYVIFNLLKNSLYAIRSAQKGEISIWLESGEVCNSVFFRDTAEGIDEENLEKIFDSFYTTREGGTGAGLAFCKRTLQSFGGDIVCRSVKNQFCEFELSLPNPGSFS